MDASGAEPKEVEAHYTIKTLPAAALFKLEYRNVIVAPFLNSLRSGNDLFKLIDRDAYYLKYAKFIDLLASKPNSIIRIATLSDDTVLGWCLSEETKVHYIWVKKEVRRKGIAQSLLPKSFDTITHLTRVAMRLWAAHYPEVKFDPF